MNIFIIIIEQGYVSIKYRRPYDWMEDKDNAEKEEQFQEEDNIKSANKRNGPILGL